MQCSKCGFYDVFTPHCPRCHHLNTTSDTTNSIDQKDLNSQSDNNSKSAASVSLEILNTQDKDNNFLKNQESFIKNKDESFVLNPNGSISLKIYNVEHKNIIEIKNILKQGFILGSTECAKMLVPIVIKTNLKCKQIDDYVTKYKDDFSNGIEPPIILFNYPSLIFSYQSQNFNEIQKLIETYNYKNIYFYVKHSGGPLKIKRIKKTQRDYNKYIDLCSAGLAETGDKIPLNEILGTMSINEIKDILPLRNKIEYNRKNKIIDFLLNDSNLSEIIKTYIPFDEFFMILPFYKGCKLTCEDISTAIDYSLEISEIICHTYFHSNNQQFYNDIKDDKTIIGIKIISVNDSRLCDLCERISAKECYQKDKRIIPPFHIGCRCEATPVFLNEKITSITSYEEFKSIKKNKDTDFQISVVNKD